MLVANFVRKPHGVVRSGLVRAWYQFLTNALSPVCFILLNTPEGIAKVLAEEFFRLDTQRRIKITLKDAMRTPVNPLEEVGLGQVKNLIYRTNMSKQFEGLQRQCTFCQLR